MNTACDTGNNVSVNSLTVHGKGLDALGNVIGVLDLDVECCTSELTGYGVAVPSLRNGRIDLQSVVRRNDTEDILGNCNEVPCSCTCEP